MSSLDPLDLDAQVKADEDRQTRSRELARIEGEDFKWLMSDKRGRRFVWSLLEKTGVYRSSFTGNSETFFREGARNVGLMVMAMVHENCPARYNLMVEEQKELKEQHDRGSKNRHR